MLNAADLNFAVFNRLLFPGGHEGLFFSIFVFKTKGGSFTNIIDKQCKIKI